MIKKIITIILCILVITVVTAQDYPLIKVAEFDNKNEEGYLYYRLIVAPHDDQTGNDLVFDEQGYPILFQHDTGKLYILNKDTYKTEVVYNTPLRNSSYEKLIKAENNQLIYFSPLSNIQITDYSGTRKVYVPYLGFTINSMYYQEASKILLFIDAQYKLHSIVNPGIDEAQNKANYRTPEETIALFESGTDLQGLTRDEKGRIYNNGKFVSNGKIFVPVLNEVRYIYGSQLISIGLPNSTSYINIDVKSSSNEIHESTAVHQSGDIYLLRYNKDTDKHILYKIENTWDLDAKKVFETR